MFSFNFNLLASHSYEKATEELKLISYVWEEFRICNSFRFKHLTDSLLKQSSNFIADILFLIRFREEIIIITVTDFCVKDSVSLFFFFVNWLLIQLDCSQPVQLDCSWSVCLLLSISLDIRKKFTIFNEVRAVAKKALNKIMRRMITVWAEWSVIVSLNISCAVIWWTAVLIHWTLIFFLFICSQDNNSLISLKLCLFLLKLLQIFLNIWIVLSINDITDHNILVQQHLKQCLKLLFWFEQLSHVRLSCSDLSVKFAQISLYFFNEYILWHLISDKLHQILSLSHLQLLLVFEL